jgi:hypothetical protein
MGTFHNETRYRFNWLGWLVPVTVSVMDAIVQTYDADCEAHNASDKPFWPGGTYEHRRVVKC